MNLASNVFLFRMVNRFVFRVLVCDPEIRGQLIGIDGLRLPGHVLPNEALQRLAVASLDHLQADGPAALYGSDHDNLVVRVAMPHTLDLAADERFIGLYDALQELGVHFVESGTDTMTQIPRGLVAHAKSALELVCRDALFALDDEVDCKKPFPQRKVGIVKDGASGNREPIAA